MPAPERAQGPWHQHRPQASEGVAKGRCSQDAPTPPTRTLAAGGVGQRAGSSALDRKLIRAQPLPPAKKDHREHGWASAGRCGGSLAGGVVVLWGGGVVGWWGCGVVGWVGPPWAPPPVMSVPSWALLLSAAALVQHQSPGRGAGRPGGLTNPGWGGLKAPKPGSSPVSPGDVAGAEVQCMVGSL